MSKIKMIKVKKEYSNNDRLLYFNILAGVLIKGFAIIISFLTTSYYIKYFKNDTILGIWYTLLNVLQWLLIFDFGIGNGLRNKIVPILKDKKKLKIYISSGYLAISIISIILLGFCIFAILKFDLNVTFNIKYDIISLRKFRLVMFITLVGIMIQFVLKIITSLLYAIQKNVSASITPLITNMIVLIFLIANSKNEVISETKLLNLAFIYAIATNIPLLFQSIISFKKYFTGCAPSIKYFNVLAAKSVLKLSGGFFIIQIGLLVLTSSNSWLINSIYKNSDVVLYQNYYKLFSLVPTFFALLSQPVWSGISIAMAEKRIEWIKKKYHLLLLVALCASFISIIEALGIKLVFKIWLGSEYRAEMLPTLIFCLLTIEHLFMYATTSVANGMNKIGCQIIFSIIICIIKIPLSFLSKNIIDNWISVVVVEAACMLVIIIIQPIYNSINLKIFKRN
jgi:O-antigen/teichoic acid export membrane protein